MVSEVIKLRNGRIVVAGDRDRNGMIERQLQFGQAGVLGLQSIQSRKFSELSP